MTNTEIIVGNVSEIIKILKGSTFIDREDYELVVDRLNNIVSSTGSEKSSNISPTIHSQPQHGCLYWAKRKDSQEYEVAKVHVFDDRFLFIFRDTGRVDVEYLSDWKKEPLIPPKD